MLFLKFILFLMCLYNVIFLIYVRSEFKLLRLFLRGIQLTLSIYRKSYVNRSVELPTFIGKENNK